MNINGVEIGKELMALRKKNNISLEYLSKELDVHTNTLSKYEKDASDMKLSLLEKLLSYYEMDILIFFKLVREYNHKENQNKV